MPWCLVPGPHWQRRASWPPLSGHRALGALFGSGAIGPADGAGALWSFNPGWVVAAQWASGHAATVVLAARPCSLLWQPTPRRTLSPVCALSPSQRSPSFAPITSSGGLCEACEHCLTPPSTQSSAPPPNCGRASSAQGALGPPGSNVQRRHRH